MKVFFVQGAAERGGGERVLLALCRQLPAHGIEPVIGFLADGPFVAEARAAGVATVAIPARIRLREPWKASAAIAAIARAADDASADVLHANGEKMALYSTWAARRAGVPAVVWLHDAPKRSAAASALQAALRFAPPATLVACSPWLARTYESRWRVPVQAIANGIDLDALPTIATDPRPVAGWSPTTTVVGHFGRLQQWKGADVFLRAAAVVAPAHEDARFVVVGGALYGWEQDYARSLPTLAASLGIADRVHFTGHRDDALALMAGCDVVVHSSVRDEPFGLVIAEAMALARPVIASRSGGPEGIVDHPRTGLLTTPGQVGELHDALAALLADPGRRETMGRDGQRVVHDQFSAAAMARSFAALYRGLRPAPASVAS